MRSPTIALAIEFKDGHPILVETISDSREISLLEEGTHLGELDPLRRIYEHRQKQREEDEEFSNYVEELLSRPFLKAEIQTYGVRWLKSRIRIEQFQKEEAESAKIIARYAFEIFSCEPTLRDFVMAGPRAQVRVRIFVVRERADSAKSA